MDAMTHKVNWLHKKFVFDFPVERYVDLLEELRETPSKLEALGETFAKGDSSTSR